MNSTSIIDSIGMPTNGTGGSAAFATAPANGHATSAVRPEDEVVPLLRALDGPGRASGSGASVGALLGRIAPSGGGEFGIFAAGGRSGDIARIAHARASRVGARRGAGGATAGLRLVDLARDAIQRELRGVPPVTKAQGYVVPAFEPAALVGQLRENEDYRHIADACPPDAVLRLPRSTADGAAQTPMAANFALLTDGGNLRDYLSGLRPKGEGAAAAAADAGGLTILSVSNVTGGVGTGAAATAAQFLHAVCTPARLVGAWVWSRFPTTDPARSRAQGFVQFALLGPHYQSSDTEFYTRLGPAGEPISRRGPLFDQLLVFVADHVDDDETTAHRRIGNALSLLGTPVGAEILADLKNGNSAYFATLGSRSVGNDARLLLAGVSCAMASRLVADATAAAAAAADATAGDAKEDPAVRERLRAEAARAVGAALQKAAGTADLTRREPVEERLAFAPARELKATAEGELSEVEMGRAGADLARLREAQGNLAERVADNLRRRVMNPLWEEMRRSIDTAREGGDLTAAKCGHDALRETLGAQRSALLASARAERAEADEAWARLAEAVRKASPAAPAPATASAPNPAAVMGDLRAWIVKLFGDEEVPAAGAGGAEAARASLWAVARRAAAAWSRHAGNATLTQGLADVLEEFLRQADALEARIEADREALDAVRRTIATRARALNAFVDERAADYDVFLPARPEVVEALASGALQQGEDAARSGGGSGRAIYREAYAAAAGESAEGTSSSGTVNAALLADELLTRCAARAAARVAAGSGIGEVAAALPAALVKRFVVDVIESARPFAPLTPNAERLPDRTRRRMLFLPDGKLRALLVDEGALEPRWEVRGAMSGEDAVIAVIWVKGLRPRDFANFTTWRDSYEAIPEADRHRLFADARDAARFGVPYPCAEAAGETPAEGRGAESEEDQ